MAFVVGGDQTEHAVEIFSPDGKCQHRLADIPINGSFYHIPVLALVDNGILSCGGHTGIKVHRSCFNIDQENADLARNVKRIIQSSAKNL